MSRDFAIVYSRSDLFVIGYHRAGIAECSQILLDDEAGGDGVGQFANFESIAVRVNGLRAIFDHE